MTLPKDSEKDLEKLNEEAFAVADHFRSGYYSLEAARADLVQRCPGFTNAQYEDAFAKGLKDSR